MSDYLEYQVDGAVFRAADDLIDGRAVRVSAGRTPASGFVLIRIDGGIAQSVGLEEPIQLEEGRQLRFRTFESDHANMFTVDERGWEWGADVIGEAEVREIAGIPDDHDLYLDSDADRLIDRESQIRLSGKGVEHIRSRKTAPKTITIIVNARKHQVKPGTISFEELLVLAFAAAPSGPNVCFTVSYRKGPKTHPEGSLLPGQSVHVIEGMTFHVTATDKS
jgi:hypothetical protein